MAVLPTEDMRRVLCEMAADRRTKVGQNKGTKSRCCGRHTFYEACQQAVVKVITDIFGVCPRGDER